jgi:hypothetical protein
MRERAVDLLPARLLGSADALEDLLLVSCRDVALESDDDVAGYGLRRLLRGSGLRHGTAQREQAGHDGEKERYATGAVHSCQGGSGRIPTTAPSVGL